MRKLTATGAKAAMSKPGRHGDGDGLFLEVGKSGSASWIVRVQKGGKRRDIGLGSAKKVTLARARDLASAARIQVEAGIDPVAERRKAAGVPTFRQAATLFHGEQKKAWANGKHRDQWLSTLTAYAFPSIGDVPVNEVEASQVRDLLAAIWLTKNETARRVRQRVSAVIDWSVGKGFREAALPMAVINRALPKVAEKGGHHAALAYTDLPAFMARIRERETWGRLALEAAVLTAARSGEIREATWSEVNLDTGLWSIPAARMKAKREHVVPLSPAAVAVLRRARALNSEGARFIFEGMKPDKPMSDMTLTKVLRDMEAGCTAHGFRSTFRDWVAETTNYPGELAEAALAHAIPNKVEAAYRRGNLLEKRRALMNAWADYCGGGRDNVVAMVAA